VDMTSDHLRIAASIGKSFPPDLPAPTQDCDERLRSVLEEGVSVRLHAPQESAIGLQSGDAVKAVLQVPLKTGERIAGLLSVDRQDTGTPFGKHDEQVLAILADYAAIALEKYRKVEGLAAANPDSRDNSAEPV
jgi:GAF domain-containing protein